jgi:hypothetical protein
MSEYQEVETIIGKKITKGKILYCVKWKHMGVLNSTWETVDSFANIKKLKAMSKMLDVRCRRIKKKKMRERRDREKDSRKATRSSRKKARRRKGPFKSRHKGGHIRVLSEDSQEKDESVYCVFQDEYVVDIGSEVFKQNRRLKNCWEEKLAREKEKRLYRSGKKVQDAPGSVDEILVINSKSQDQDDLKPQDEHEKGFSNKNVLYTFDDSLNPKGQEELLSQDTSLICKRHSNQAVETLGLCDLKKKHDKMLLKNPDSKEMKNGSAEAERRAEVVQNSPNNFPVIVVD